MAKRLPPASSSRWASFLGVLLLLQSSSAFQNSFQSITRRSDGASATWNNNKHTPAVSLHSTTTDDSTPERVQDIRFDSPLLEEGYPPTVEEEESGLLQEKPLLIYLPGFDGTWMAPFLQLPELSTSFDVRCLTMSMKDRSTYEELKAAVVDYIVKEVQTSDNETDGDPSSSEQLPPVKRNFFSNILKQKPSPRSVYLAGESFGGILASDVALTLLEDEYDIDLKGMTLINAATCYDRSKLASMGPGVASLPKLLYPFGLLRLLPLFTDDYSFDQLLMILKAQGLPSVIDSAQREAFMGRIAFSIPQKLQYLPQGTLEWRLSEWLERGCAKMETRLESFRSNNFRSLIIAGELDLCLPSIGEAERLASLFSNSHVHVVEGAGHASTCGSRVDLAALMRNRFPELKEGRKAMKPLAASGKGVDLGMEPRYDGRDDIGLSPFKYWRRANYRKYKAGNKEATDRMKN
jgi:pimeloyl-ACP methyl ester carboxylesterase